MRSLVGVSILLCCSIAVGQTRTVVDITGLADGQYILTIAGGQVTAVPVNVVTLGGDGPTPEPPTPPAPPVVTVESRVRSVVSVRDAATRDQMSVRWAAIAAMAEQQVLSSTKQMVDGINASVDQVLSRLPEGPARNEWITAADKVMDVVSDEEDRIIDATGRQPTVAEFVAIFQAVSKGLATEDVVDFAFVDLKELISNPSGAILAASERAVNWKELLQIILEIIKLLRDLGIIPAPPTSPTSSIDVSDALVIKRLRDSANEAISRLRVSGGW